MEKAAEAQIPRLSASKPDGDTTSSAASMLEKETGGQWAPRREGDREGEESTPDAENQGPSASSSTENVEAGDVETGDYVTGYKLALLLFSVTTFFFLLMLDMSIISTVSGASCSFHEQRLMPYRMIGHPADHLRLP